MVLGIGLHFTEHHSHEYYHSVLEYEHVHIHEDRIIINIEGFRRSQMVFVSILHRSVEACSLSKP